MNDKKRSPQSIEELTQIIRQLLSTWSEVYQGGDSFINFEELGPREPGGLPLNAAAIRRWFQNRPEELKCIKRKVLDSVEAYSYYWLEVRMAELRKRAPNLADPIDHIHFRSTSGHNDAEWVLGVLRRKAEKYDDWQASNQVWLYERGIEILAQRAQNDQRLHDGPDLHATMKKVKSIREDDAKDKRDAQYYKRFLFLIDKQDGDGMSVGLAYKTLERETGLSNIWLKQLMSKEREKEGEPPRKRGRPPKEQKGA